ncbi:hypothetical protein SAMN05216302_100788 [Nitrosomonas aestuarii]|uniref:Uncharacterized protein n=1 Tax=Nitrosomonas aestuarii TaxID=52441 RepID=A0A1I3ZVW8_9PROT|nr:hypothetical protein [Nitrosomonas aestuarii]SFK48143.1 hypothetical protein SAMN05216302_100788 [Nitrosomonas aestuarii]
MIKLIKILVISLLVLEILSACSTVHKPTQTSRSAIEQLLLSEAVIKSLPDQLESALPIPHGANVVLDTSGIISEDKDIVRQVMAGWLGKNGYHVMVGWFGEEGYHVQGDINMATHRINVIVGSLGTEFGETFIGVPPIQSVVIPFATPELALYKAQYQTGFVKLYFDIYELPSNRFVGSTSPFFAETHYNDYTVLFLFSFKKTDLILPPKLGSFEKTVKDQAKDKPSPEEQK